MTRPGLVAELPSEVVLDASVLINLLATEETARILSALPAKFLVERRTAVEIRRQPGASVGDASVLEPFVETGLLTIATFASDALEEFVALARYMDDGEAAALTLACSNGSGVAVDDQRAVRICRERHPQVITISTVELLRAPAVHEALGQEQLVDCLMKALRVARMRVFPDDEAWVLETIGVERAAGCSSLRARCRVSQ